MDKDTLLEQLQNNHKCRAFLASYGQDSADDFLKHYVDEKYRMLQRSKEWRDPQRYNESYFRGRAEKFYWIIAQKKLFNLQCLWRAGQVELPVQVGAEFDYWGRNIMSCPFNEPVTTTDIEAKLAYLHRPFSDVYEEPWDMLWQDYDDFKEDGGTGAWDYYPDWYAFYDAIMGTGALLSLPDLKGEEEERYMEAWRKENHQNHPEPPPEVPTIWYNEERAIEFIRAVESPAILRSFVNYWEAQQDRDFQDSLRPVLTILSHEEVPAPVPAGNFPDVLYEALFRLEARKMETLLPLVHEAHLERQAMGIGYEQDCPLEEDHIVAIWKKGIQRGKEILGEE